MEKVIVAWAENIIVAVVRDLECMRYFTLPLAAIKDMVRRII